MSEAQKKPLWMRSLHWLVIILLCGLWGYLEFQDQEEERRERQGQRLREEISEKVGADLRAKSKARHEKLMKDLKNITKTDAGAPEAQP